MDQRLGRAAPGAEPLPHLADRDRDQPGPEGLRLAEVVQVAQDPQHDVLHDVVHVGVTLERAPDDRVDQRQVAGDQPVDRGMVAGAGRDDGRDVDLFRHVRAFRVALSRPFRGRPSMGDRRAFLE
jgi:hypothetical protein